MSDLQKTFKEEVQLAVENTKIDAAYDDKDERNYLYDLDYEDFIIEFDVDEYTVEEIENYMKAMQVGKIEVVDTDVRIDTRERFLADGYDKNFEMTKVNGYLKDFASVIGTRPGYHTYALELSLWDVREVA